MAADLIFELVTILIDVVVEVGGAVATDQAVTRVRAHRAATTAPGATRVTPSSRVFDSPLTYVVIGAALGGATLLIWPERVAHRPDARVGLVFITTMIGGAVMAAIGAHRRRLQRPTGTLATFTTGALFALAFAAARAFGHWVS